MRLSVAVPLYNEEANVPELLRRVAAVLDAVPGGPHELVCVDDGSSDRTVELVSAAAAADPRITLVVLSRNFGHQAALSAALQHATGDVVVMMDGDLQDPPEAIPRLLEQYHRGYDVVYVTRVQRKEPWHLRLAYRLAYRLIARLSSIDVPVDAGDFSLMSRRVVDVLNGLPERQRYLRGLRSWAGFRQTGIEVERDARRAGTSKYTFSKLLQLAIDGMLTFSAVPLRAAAATGALAVVASLLFAAYSVYVRLVVGHSPEGFTALIVALTFLSGVQLLFLGVIGEYLGRIFNEVKDRPAYVVERVVRSPDGSSVRPPVS
ncbi:MAG: glycosyltransferase family 2 protein [Acidobacteriota bacterium]|jgi:glycosyltransferase involved in cell wall biosynthesis|nr:MAG: glycosyltransferase [Acidobacteriota bacterium]